MKRFFRILSNQKGVSLIEMMTAIGILAVGVVMVMRGVDSMQDMTKQTRNMSSTDRQVAMIVENIRTSLGQYQVHFNYSADSKSEALDVDNLPMEWSAGVERPISNDCRVKKICLPGRYGFIIQPIENYRGLYEVTLRMTHTDWKDKYREFRFLATVQ